MTLHREGRCASEPGYPFEGGTSDDLIAVQTVNRQVSSVLGWDGR
jgi:hypothetical protein